MFVHYNNAFLICDLFDSIDFYSHFHSYEGSSSGTVDLINIRFIYLIMSYCMSHMN